MKRLLILTTVALVTTSSVGCQRLCWWRRGDACDTCATAPSSPYMTYSGEAAYDTYVPAPPVTVPTLPGPVMQSAPVPMR